MDYVKLPQVSLLLFLAELASAVAIASVLLALAVSLREFARGLLVGKALRSLRFAAMASLLWPIATVVSQSLRWTAFSELIFNTYSRHIVIDVTAIFWPALLAAAVWTCLWAVEEGGKAQGELKEFV